MKTKQPVNKEAVKNEKKSLQILKIFFRMLVKILLEATKMPPSVSNNDLRPQRPEQSPNVFLGLGLWFQRTVIVLANETRKSFFSGGSPFYNAAVLGAGGVTLYHIVRIPHAMFKTRAFRYNLTLSYKSHGCLIFVTVHLIHHNSTLTSWSELHDKYKETEKNLAIKTDELDQVQNRLLEVSRALESEQLTFTKTVERTEQATTNLEILERVQLEDFTKINRDHREIIATQLGTIMHQEQIVKLSQAEVQALQQVKKHLEEQVELLKGQVKEFKQELEALKILKKGQQEVLEKLNRVASSLETHNPDGAGAPTSTTGDTQ